MSDVRPETHDAHTEHPSLKGRRAVITGGTTGIGRAIAVLLASEGARVFVCGRDPDHLADALARIAEVGEGSGVTADLAQADENERVFTEAEKYLGGVDIAVVNAAVPAKGISDPDVAQIQEWIAIDFTAYLLSTKAAVSRMGAGSDIVLIGSTSAVSRTGSAVYTAAKTALQGFAPALRLELADKDIKVGLIEPGFTGSDFQYPEYPPEKQVEMIHANTMLRAEDIAVAVQYMLQQPRRTAVSLIRVESRLEAE